jgi:hypothetical protein
MHGTKVITPGDLHKMADRISDRVKVLEFAIRVRSSGYKRSTAQLRITESRVKTECIAGLGRVGAMW